MKKSLFIVSGIKYLKNLYLYMVYLFIHGPPIPDKLPEQRVSTNIKQLQIAEGLH